MTEAPNGAATKRPQDQFAARNSGLLALGSLLREKREAAGKSLRGMATALRCCVNAYRRVEAGAVPMKADQLIRAAKEVGVEPGELLAVDPALFDETI